MCAKFQSKWTILNFSAQIYPKKDLELEIEKSNVRIRINIVETLCANFQPNWTTLTLFAQICPKMDLGLEIQKTNVGIRISIVKRACMPIFRKNEQLWLFLVQICPKRKLGFEIQKTNVGIRNSIFEIPSLRYQFSDKTDNFDFFRRKFAQKWILWSKF